MEHTEMCMHMHVYDHPSSIGTMCEACTCVCVSTGRSKAVVGCCLISVWHCSAKLHYIFPYLIVW